MSITVQVRYNNLPQIIQALEEAKAVAVRQVATAIADTARATYTRDTGATAESVYVVTSDSSTYPRAVSRARAADGTRTMLSELPRPQMGPGRARAYVAVAAANGVYLELGTSRAPAQPALIPAAAQHTDELAERMGAALRALLARSAR